MVNYSLIDEAWESPLMKQNNEGYFVLQPDRQDNSDLLKNNVQYNFKPKPNRKPSSNDYGLDNYNLNKIQNLDNINLRNNEYNPYNYNNIEYDTNTNPNNNLDSDLEYNTETDTDSDEEIQYNRVGRRDGRRDGRSDERSGERKNKKESENEVLERKSKLAYENKINELHDHIRNLESDIYTMKTAEINRKKSVFGDINTNEMLIFLSMGIFVMITLDAFVKLGKTFKKSS